MECRSSGKTGEKPRCGRFAVTVGLIALFSLVFLVTLKSQMKLGLPLAVAEQDLNFGMVWEQPQFTWRLPVRNTTDHAVEIDGFEVSCSCVSIEPKKFTIPAQETAELSLTMNLVTAHRELELVGKDFKVTILPRILHAAELQPSWVVQGKVLQSFAADPPVIDFEESLIQGQPFPRRSATITCGVQLAELKADSPTFTTSLARHAKDPRRFRLEIQAPSSLPAGSFSHLVRLTGVTAEKKELSGVVPVVGRVLRDVQLVPEVLAFAAEPLGSRVHDRVVVRSHSDQNLAIEAIDTGSAAGLHIAVEKMQKDGSQALAVSFMVTELGLHEYPIHVRVRARQGTLDFTLPLICHGVPAQQEDKQ